MHYGDWIYIILFLIIFCETGLVITAIMPGDSLLFASGVIAANGVLNLYLLIVLLIIAAFLGNIVNYWIGYKFSQWLLNNKRFPVFKRSYFDKTHAFYEKYGGKTIIIARFIPIIRTFAPFIAGMGKMCYFRFVLYNFIGAFFWVSLLLCISYWFGNIPFVHDHFSLFIFTIIVISISPPLIGYVKSLYKNKINKNL